MTILGHRLQKDLVLLNIKKEKIARGNKNYFCVGNNALSIYVASKQKQL
jgi:hypothetical protein